MSKVVLALSLLSTLFFAHSQPLTVRVLSEDGEGIANVVVYLNTKELKSDHIPNEIAIMDQVDTQFLPHILAVQKDSQIRFPNSDSVKHHVYSFSPAKTFELQLYKELNTDPLLFSKTGAVVLGCNIHDWMLGYIFVVDTPYFGKTDVAGAFTLDMPDGNYQLEVWHPRIRDELSTLSRQIVLPRESEIKIMLELSLSPDLNQYEDVSEEFSDYE